MRTVLVTGGCGFIGSAVVRRLLRRGFRVVNYDALTYAGNPDSLREVLPHPGYVFVHADIRDRAALEQTLARYEPDAVMHLAAETHVDRSIEDPERFVDVNITGTLTLLEAVRRYWSALPEAKRSAFRLHHISTDEVYGDLGPDDPPFREGDPYRPSSPYAASKAGSDHLVRAWHRTYGLPVIVTNCSNNYGPYQFPEKLIPHMILRALKGEPLPVYGRGDQVRDWLYVEDHAEALELVLTKGRIGETYHIGGEAERKNIEVVRTICACLEELAPEKPQGVKRYEDLITFVADRPGHDRRYAMDITKIRTELGWRPKTDFEAGIRRTVAWYLDHRWWWSRILDGSYRLERLGLVREGR